MIDQIQLFCSDIDGTLLTEDRWISDRTVSAFAKANLPLILASSRPPQAMRYLQERLAIPHEPLISFNGGLIIGRDNIVLESYTFTTAVLEAILEHHRKGSYNVSIYSYEKWFTEVHDQHTKHEIFTTRDQPVIQDSQATLSELNSIGRGIHKIMCMGEANELDAIVALLEPLYSDKVHLYRSKDTYLEITPKHIDKSTALKRILSEYYNLDLNAVMAFGDNHNDEALISSVGYGVAVSNATEKLKGMSNYVSSFTNKEDAVARVIEKHF